MERRNGCKARSTIVGMKLPKLQTLDVYIIKKFLGTFFYSIALIISIAIVFDISENLDDFISKDISVSSIIFDYYLNFIPHFANLFSSLFTFIAVIYFTSKLTGNSEIIALLSSGISFNRLTRPYLISASIIALFSFLLGAYIIPSANKKRVDFRNTYINSKSSSSDNRYIHRQISPDTYIYMNRFVISENKGIRFTMETFNDGILTSKLSANSIQWNEESKKWTLNNFAIRDIEGLNENIITGTKKDTTLNMVPEDYNIYRDQVETMTLPELNRTIKSMKQRGVNNTEYKIQKHSHFATPFSAFILTIIGLSLASKKVKGGLGLHLGIGMLISFSYIMLMQITTVFADSGVIPAIIACWLPNILFGAFAVYLYKRASL